jgi:hypothetical protein
MVMFLRKFKVGSERNEFVKYNAPKTSLLDRYFMIVNGITKYEELERIHLND